MPRPGASACARQFLGHLAEGLRRRRVRRRARVPVRPALSPARPRAACTPGGPAPRWSSERPDPPPNGRVSDAARGAPRLLGWRDVRSPPEYRAHFDFDIRFANGGGLTGEGVPARRALGRHLRAASSSCCSSRTSDSPSSTTVELTRPARSSRSRTAAAAESRCRAARTSPRRRPQPPDPRRARDLPGLPAPTITPHLTREDSRAKYAPGTEFAIDIITMVGNTGTYLDSPFHRYAEGPDLAGLDLSTPRRPAAPRCSTSTDAWAASRGIRPETLADRDVRGAAVLLHTGWDRRFGTPEYGRGRAVPHRARARSGSSTPAPCSSASTRSTSTTPSPAASARALAAARRRRPRRRAPHEPRRAAAAGRALHGGAARRRGLRHVPGARLRRDRLTRPHRCVRASELRCGHSPRSDSKSAGPRRARPSDSPLRTR